MQKYYSLVKMGSEASINIYGDIVSWKWVESDVTAYDLSKQLEEMQDVDTIHVHINSYGGEVKEGLAIYNALRAHKAKVITYCDSFACSIASVIFMAGDERLMNTASLLMIHNAWTIGQGNSEELRKIADDLEVITSASVEAYKARATISEEEIRKLMDAESWIAPAKAIEYGFATGIVEEKSENVSQSAREKLYNIVLAAQESAGEENEGEGEEVPTPEENPVETPNNGEEERVSEVSQQMVGFFNAIF